MTSQDIPKQADDGGIEAQGADTEQVLQHAVAHLQNGRLSEAEAIYRQVLRQQPDHPIALHMLGLLRYQNGDTQHAVEMLERAIAAKPDFAEACKNLANIYAELDQPDNAIARYRQAVAISPNLFEAHYNLGSLLQEQKRLDEACVSYQEALAIKPDLTEARSRLNEVLHLLTHAAASRLGGGDLPAETSLGIQQKKAEDLCKKAVSYQQQGKADEAIAHYHQAIAVKPDFAEAHNNLGNLLANKGRLKEALVSFQNVSALEPDRFIGYSQVGNALRLLNRYQDAAASFRRAIALEPYRAQLYLNLSLAIKEQGKLEEASAMCEKALQLQPDFTPAFNTLATIRNAQGQVEEAIALRRRALKLNPNNADAESDLVMSMHYLPGYSPEDLLAAAKNWAAHHIPRERCLSPPANSPDPQRRLRVGYVSGDFHTHPVGLFMESVLTHHDRSGYETFCYYNDTYNNGEGDSLTKRLRQLADHWTNISWQADRAIAEQIRRDGIDILVDLAGHTNKNRLVAFGHRPAPVQATWFGYFGTTGLDTMDHIIADRFVIPPGEERYYTERVVRLPHAYECFHPPEYSVEPGPLPALATGKITFGSFNNTAKLTEAVIACWSRLLRALPDAQLYLKYRPFGDPGVRRRYQSLFAGHGIAIERIKLAGYSPRKELLAAYREVDIGLDPFPFNGGVTTLESLWMGVPVVNLRGDRFVSHVGETILMNLGLEQHVVDCEEDYISMAAALAADLPRLAELRGRLRALLLNSPLCDGAGFTRDVEAAYRNMWESWCRTLRQSRS